MEEGITLPTNPPLPLRTAMRKYIEKVMEDSKGKTLAAVAALEIAWTTYFRMKKRWQRADGERK